MTTEVGRVPRASTGQEQRRDPNRRRFPAISAFALACDLIVVSERASWARP
jgi:hypothetical protein